MSSGESVDDASRSRPQDARRTVTILFSDLVDSTSLGEELDAETVVEVLDSYFDRCREVIEHHGGVVEKFIGDAVMALFGIPTSHEDDALRAVRAAQGMRVELDRLNLDLGLSRGVRLVNRTGVNTGMVVSRHVSDHQRMATGDAVNVAARLEAAAPPGGIVLGESTWRLVRQVVTASALGPLQLKGRAQTVEAYLLDALDAADRAAKGGGARQLVGRATELGLIEAHLRRAIRGGTPEGVLILGEPGVGKTRLMQEIATSPPDGARVLTAACRPYGTTTFWPLAQLIHRLDPDADTLDHVGLARITSQVTPSERTPVIERISSILGLSDVRFPIDECFWAIARLLQAVRLDRPLILLLEDVHWADDGLLDLLDHLRMSGQGAGFLMLATARPEIVERRWERPTPHLELVHLGLLSSSECDGVIDGMLGGLPVPTEVRQFVNDAAEGNPLFIEQVLTTWIEDGVLSRGADAWTLTRPVTRVDIPETVAAIFAARLDRLPPAERAVLEAAAVIGPVFPVAALRPMLIDVGSEELDRSVRELVVDEYLHPIGNPRVERLAFAHASLRDVTYATTLKSHRATLHERFADWRTTAREETQRDGSVGHHLAEAFRYRTELRIRDAHTADLATRGLARFTTECRRSLGIGDRSAAERLVGRIVAVAPGVVAAGIDPDLSLLADVAKLLVTLGRWNDVVEIMTPYAESANGPLLRDLGVALCQLHRDRPHSVAYRQGQRLLESASAPPSRDLDALASLAGSWRGVNDTLALTLYRRCLEIDPADPYALGNVIDYAIAESGDLSIVEALRDQLLQARDRCRAQAGAGENLPWAHFDAGKFALMLGDPQTALTSHAKAAQLAGADHVLATSRAAIQRMVSALHEELPGTGHILDLLDLARAARFASPAISDALQAQALADVSERTAVVMIAGGTEDTTEEWLREHQDAVVDAFDGFSGLLVSGGTDRGVAGLVGAVRERLGPGIRALGYLPSARGDGARPDPRYDELRRGSEPGFSIGQPLQAWRDLLASGVNAGAVRVLAINGGEIAAAEFRIALALGSRVGVMAGSGRAADELLADRDWVTAPGLIRLDIDRGELQQFVAAHTRIGVG